MSKKDQILKLLKAGKSIGEVAKAVKTKPGYVYYIRWMDLNKSCKKAGKKESRLLQEAAATHKALNAAAQREKELAPVRAHDEELADAHRVAREFLESKLVQGIDVVNHPPHYRTGGIDTLDFIEAKDLNFRLANVVKYVVRCGKKASSDPIQDLEKAMFYLKREIEVRKGA